MVKAQARGETKVSTTSTAARKSCEAKCEDYCHGSSNAGAERPKRPAVTIF